MRSQQAAKSLRSLYSPVNSEDVVQDLIEEHQRDVQLLFIEDLQTGLHIVPQLLLFHWDVVLHSQIINKLSANGNQTAEYLRSILSASVPKQEYHSLVNLFLVYLGKPVAVEDRPIESLLLINVGEVFESNHVDVFICPPSLFITNQPGERFQMNHIITKIIII